MSKGHLAKGPIAPDVLTAAVDSIKQLIETLKPYEVNLSEEEKKHIPKSGDRTTAFVEKGIGYMRSNPEYLSGVMNADEAANDRLTQKQAIDLNEQIKIIAQMLTDLSIAAGSDAYTAVLDYYSSVKRAADKGSASAKQITEDLGVIFKKSDGDPIPGIDLP